MLACVFEKFVKVLVKEFGINPLYCVSLPGYTWQGSLKNFDIELQTLQDEDVILLCENNVRGGMSSIMSNRYVKSDGNKKHCISTPIVYMVTICHNRYHSMKLNLIQNEKLEDILTTNVDSDSAYFVEADSKYPDNIKQIAKHFPFAPENGKK